MFAFGLVYSLYQLHLHIEKTRLVSCHSTNSNIIIGLLAYLSIRYNGISSAGLRFVHTSLNMIIILLANMQAHIIIIAGSGHTGSIRDGRTIRLTFRENRENREKSKKRQR